MLASEAKLAQNNLTVVLQVLDALRVIREHGGFGTIELEVQNGIAPSARIVVKKILVPKGT